MINELLGIQYSIAKANVTDRKVQNLVAYINEDSLKAIHMILLFDVLNDLKIKESLRN